MLDGLKREQVELLKQFEDKKEAMYTARDGKEDNAANLDKLLDKMTRLQGELRMIERRQNEKN